jgi:hypothetical protein
LHREPRETVGRHTSTVPFFFSQLKLVYFLKARNKNVRAWGRVWGFPLLLLLAVGKEIKEVDAAGSGSSATARATEAPNELELTKVPILPEPLE